MFAEEQNSSDKARYVQRKCRTGLERGPERVGTVEKRIEGTTRAKPSRQGMVSSLILLGCGTKIDDREL